MQILRLRMNSDYISAVYRHISKYAHQSWSISIWNIFTTVCLLLFCFTYMNIFLIPLFSLTLVRSFIIFHDLAHSNFFPSKKLNYIFGNIFGVIVFTPLSNWVKEHNLHHEDSNNLDKKQYSQTAIWSSERYHNQNFISQLKYKLIYGKYTLFTIVPWIYFSVYQHLKATLCENIVHTLYLILILYYKGLYQFLLFFVSYWLAGIIGFFIFHSQHTFEGVYKEKQERWEYFKNGIYGSSFLQVPWYLKYFTYGTEYHHVHHLNKLVPGYNLKKCHDEAGDLFDNVKRISISDVISCMHYSLYNFNSKSFENVYFN